MKPKERMAIPRQHVTELSPHERIHNYVEIVKNFDEDTAILEANRCIQCRKASCIKGCPTKNDIPGFIALLREKKFEEAYWLIRKTNTLPSVCSRVCPHEFMCEGHCVFDKAGVPVSIGMLERFLTEWMIDHNRSILEPCAPPNGKKIAIVGSGPAGATVAYSLSHLGYECTIFEAQPVFGGMLISGIPNYRLSRAVINEEINSLISGGVKIELGKCIGKDLTLLDLKNQGFDAVFIGVGASQGKPLNIPGEKSCQQIIHAVDYLRLILTKKTCDIGQKVIIIGGGNVAMDAARTALRQGVKDIKILYRRSKEEMSAAKSEVRMLEEEGIHIDFLVAPKRIILDDSGHLQSLECVKMILGEPDETGRCLPMELEGSEYLLEADYIIPAVSQSVEHLVDHDFFLKKEPWGAYSINPETFQTSIPWVFAGGDAVLGPQTVGKAINHGLLAAKSIDQYLNLSLAAFKLD